MSSGSVGRLAVIVDGHPEIFPVNFVIERRSIVFRTAAGTMLWESAKDEPAAFEIDGYEPATEEAWSVVARGGTAFLDDMNDQSAADALGARDGGWVGFQDTGGISLIGLLVLIAGFILLFTDRAGLFDLLLGLNRWIYRVITYVALMGDAYPPFQLDLEPADPGDRTRIPPVGEPPAGRSPGDPLRVAVGHEPSPLPGAKCAAIYIIYDLSTAPVPRQVQSGGRGCDEA